MADSRWGRFPDLPCRQLHEALAAQAYKHTGKAVEDWAGITQKTLGEWGSGRRRVCKFNIADRVLCHTGLHWWEVWREDNTDPEALRVVAYAFTGEFVGEQLDLAA